MAKRTGNANDAGFVNFHPNSYFLGRDPRAGGLRRQSRCASRRAKAVTAQEPKPRAINQGLGGRNQEEGSLFGPGGLFGSKADRKEDNGSGVAVNAYPVAGLARHHQFHSAGLGRSVRRRHHHRLVHAGRDAQ